MIDENSLQGMSRKIENASEGITLQIEKKEETAGPLNVYIMDAQLNIQNGAYVSAYIRIKMFMKEPHTALFVAPTGVGKTHSALNLLKNEYRHHIDFIIIICPTLMHNSTYRSRGWVWNDPDVILIEPGNNLYYLIEKISNLLTGSVTLFLNQ